MTASRTRVGSGTTVAGVGLGTAELVVLAVLGFDLIAAWTVVVAVVCLVVLARRR